MLKCPACDRKFKSYTAVSMHFRKMHGTTKQLAEIMHLSLLNEQYGGRPPTCACGCGQVPKYYDYDRGYAKYVRGHYSRVHNNWGHNDAAQKKSQDVRRKQIAAGKWKPWNNGATSETDERVAQYGRRGSHTLKTNPNCQRQRSEHMAEQWKTGSLTPKRGSAHSQWKGGVSSL